MSVESDRVRNQKQPDAEGQQQYTEEASCAHSCVSLNLRLIDPTSQQASETLQPPAYATENQRASHPPGKPFSAELHPSPTS